MSSVTPEERSAALDTAIIGASRHGWRLVSRTPTQAQLLKGKRTSHLLHLILTLLTLGIWAIVWILVTIFGGEQTLLLTVDESGVVRDSKGRSNHA